MSKRMRGYGRMLIAVFLVLSMAFNSINLVVPGNVVLPRAYAQGISSETIRRKSIVIDLGDGLKTDAQLTVPAVGDGPFPGVLLIHGSGNIDMDGYIPPQLSGTDEGSRILLQIAEYLSERGFAVLRYNKRSIGPCGAILDMDMYLGMTVHDLISDAEKALEVLMQQSEVDTSDITIIGHSEGTIIAPRIAINNTGVRNIVLMGAAAHNVYDILYWQVVDSTVFFSENVLDGNLDGLISIQDVLEAIDSGDLSYETNGLIQNITGQYEWKPEFDVNGDGYCSIENELKSYWVQFFDMIVTSDPTSPYYWPWLQSHRALKDCNLDLIGDVSTNILILQGESETQCPVEQAFLLEQKLTESNHPDHTLITYRGLGHSFYPAKGLVQPLGPIQDYVLSDLVAWLKDSARKFRDFTAQVEDFNTEFDLKASELESAKTEISRLESQVNDLQNTSSCLQNTMIELEIRNSDLQSGLTLSKNLAYVAMGVAIMAFVVTGVTLRKR
jgi:alpha/beta superfamily hydrolase